MPTPFILLALILAASAFVSAGAAPVYSPPDSPHVVSSFNRGWRFIRRDVAGADRAAFDDSQWQEVSTPHTYNDTDTYDELISHSGGERHQYMGIAWYRKHFTLPSTAQEGKVFLEFEGLKQAGRFWINGQFAGKYENGITPCGLDLTPFVKFGGADNVLAVKVDNGNNYVEEATGVGFEWMGRAFNPNYGGLNHDVWLHLTGKVYQTLPLYENLQTTGVYIYPSHFSISGHACDLAVESQVRNESPERPPITLSVAVVDAEGVLRAEFHGEPIVLAGGGMETFSIKGRLTNAEFWSDVHPALYDVYSILSVNHRVVDVQKIKTGFRETQFKGGAGRGGVYLNGRFVYLTGYAQRSSDDWAGLGQAYPDWMHDFNAQLIRASHANFIRWMHIAPQRVDVTACDKAGLVEVCPAGDKERDAEGRQWEQRLGVMRDVMIFYRNNPSILFWEAGNTVINPRHMAEMVALRKQWDPSGGRVIGCRGNSDNAANAAVTPMSEFYGVMIGQDRRTDELTGYDALFRGYSAARRDRAPLIEMEDYREEAARRFWDNFSPPFYGFKKGPDDAYALNSESFCLGAAARYHAYFINCISNTNPLHAKWSGYASIYWSDSNADGRQDSSEVARVSGKVDSVRLPKEAYYVYRVMQNPAPDIHIIGHWSYSQGTVKPIYVAANHCESVELLVNGASRGRCASPQNGYIFEFPAVPFAPGEITALGRAGDKVVARDEIESAGPAVALKLTPHCGPEGLKADGSDVAFFDVEAVDAHGRRCPTDEARVDFKLEGPAIWRGGYNSGKTNSVNNLYLDTECGVNRVAIRSRMTPGPITLTATRPGLAPAVVSLVSRGQ